MCNRITATTKLLYLIKSASVEIARGRSDSEDMESLVIEAGIHALRSLGVSQEEIAEAILGSPTMGNVDDDSTVSPRNGEDSEGETRTHTDTVSGLTFETSSVDNRP